MLWTSVFKRCCAWTPGQMATPSLISRETATLLSRAAAPLYVPARRVWAFQLPNILTITCYVFLNDSIYLFLERGRERGREMSRCERETSISCLSHVPDRNQTRNPGMRPDQESNQQPFNLQDDTQPTEPHLSGVSVFFIIATLVGVKWHLTGVLFILPWWLMMVTFISCVYFAIHVPSSGKCLISSFACLVLLLLDTWF